MRKYLIDYKKIEKLTMKNKFYKYLEFEIGGIMGLKIKNTLGFGISLLETLACGCKKVYVSNTSCFPEIFEGNVIYLNSCKVKKY